MEVKYMSEEELKSKLKEYANQGRELISSFDSINIKDIIKDYKKTLRDEFNYVKCASNCNMSNSYYYSVYVPAITEAYLKIGQINLSKSICNATYGYILDTIYELEYYSKVKETLDSCESR